MGRTPSQWPELKPGDVTLVLGAGVSASRGVPLWRQMVERLWLAVFGSDLGKQTHPLADQFALELVRNKLELTPPTHARLRVQIRRFWLAHKRRVRFTHGRTPGERLFTELLRLSLYDGEVPASQRGEKSTFEAVAHLIAAEHRRGSRRRLRRVITFNADNLLEEYLNDDILRSRVVLRPIARPHHETPPGALSRNSIPIFHVHGFLPKPLPDDAPTRNLFYLRMHGHGADQLVFTDLQYWRATASPSSFANRVVINAINDSHCVFLGLSMTDINLFRWLGFRAQEVDAAFAATGDSARMLLKRREDFFEASRHYWVHKHEPEEQPLVEQLLALRGVQTIRLQQHTQIWPLLKDWFRPADS